jgi:hypothetical protein
MFLIVLIIAKSWREKQYAVNQGRNLLIIETDSVGTKDDCLLVSIELYNVIMIFLITGTYTYDTYLYQIVCCNC